MGDNKISEAAVEAAWASMEATKNSLEMTPLDRIRLMLAAALPHLQGEAVAAEPFCHIGPFDADYIERSSAGQAQCILYKGKVPKKSVPLYLHPQPAPQSEPAATDEREPVCFITARDAEYLRNQDVSLRYLATYWKRPGDDAVPVYLAPPAQAVALAENLLSVLIEEGVLSRNGRVFQKLRSMIDGRDAGTGDA